MSGKRKMLITVFILIPAFVTPQFGYAALGTDWSMGGGEGYGNGR
jgi:hypothetical protein